MVTNSEKALFFDTGPIITLIISRLGWIIPKLKEQFGGHFYITPAVKYELTTRPLNIHRFEFEAIQVLKMIREGIFEVYENVPQSKVSQLKSLANSTFKIGKKNMDVIQAGELEAVASALQMGAEGVVMDERTLRLFIENGGGMEELLEHRFHQDVKVNTDKMHRFVEQLQGIKIIRSIELVTVAYKMGLFEDYIPPGKGGKNLFLDSVLWETKHNGCAVTEGEITELKKLLMESS